MKNQITIWFFWMLMMSSVWATEKPKKTRRSKKFRLGLTKEPKKPKQPPYTKKRRGSLILQAIDENRKNDKDELTILGSIDKSTINLNENINATNDKILEMNNAMHADDEQKKRMQRAFEEAMKVWELYKYVVLGFAMVGICMICIYILSIRLIIYKADEAKEEAKTTIKEIGNYVYKKRQQATKTIGYSLLYMLILGAMLLYLLYIFYKKRKKLNKEKRCIKR